VHNILISGLLHEIRVGPGSLYFMRAGPLPADWVRPFQDFLDRLPFR
jgi:hypothetical protein